MFASSSKDIDAKVVGSAMVVAFNAGDTPRVWRADMAHMNTATLEVVDAPQKGKYQLVLNGADKADVVGTFDDKEQAAAALRIVTAALLAGDTGGNGPARKGGLLMGVVKFVASGVAFMLIFLAILFFHRAAYMPMGGGIDMAHGPYPGINNAPPVKQGVPLPADQLLGQ